MTHHTARLSILALVALAAIVAALAIAAVTHANCYVCPGAEPAPLPRLYLPAVLQRMPAMSAEYDPVTPVATPEPDIELPLGDASQ